MKILFVFHEAEYSGASILLLRIVKWLSKNTDFSMSFLLKTNGPLAIQINEIGKVYYWDPVNPVKRSILWKIVNRVKKQKTYQDKLVEQLEKQEFDLIYANTILSSDIIVQVAHFKCIKVWHIHELELAINIIGKQYLGAEKHVNLIIANSLSTFDNLINSGIDVTKIRVIYPIIDRKGIISAVFDPDLKETLGIPGDAFLIGTSGVGIDRKGIHTFVQLPLIVDYLFPANNFYYLWVGKKVNFDIIQHDLNKSGLSKRIIFVGEQDNPFTYYKLFDIFISCSREESFGLSAIEAAALGKPLICFENTGGLEEIVREAENLTVPYLNIVEMARTIIDLYNNRDKLTKLGNKASDYSVKFDQELIMIEFAKTLTEL
jgi:glycosyltransferase involved in cell wall biosynthesis